MANIVMLPNIDKMEFPDSFTLEQIQSVVTKHLSSQKENIPSEQKDKSALSILGEDFRKIPRAVGKAVIHGVNVAPEQIGGFEKHLFTDPTRVAKNLNISGHEAVRGTLNIPNDIWQYAAHLGLAGKNNWQLYSRFPMLKQDKETIKKMGQEQKGDALEKNLIQGALLADQPVRLIGKGASLAKNAVTGAPKYAALADKLGLKTKEIAKANAQKGIEEAGLKHEQTQELEEAASGSLQEARDKAVEAGLPATYPQLKSKINKNETKLNELNQNISALSHQMENLPKAEPLKQSDISHIENANQATRAAREAQDRLKYANEHHQLATSLLPEVDRQIARHLNQGSDFPVNTSRQLKHEINSVENHWKESYKNFTNKIEKSNFHLIDSDNLNQYKENIAQAQAKYHNAPNSEFAHVISKAPNAFDRTASDFMNKQKDFRDARYSLLQRAKVEPSAVKREELFQAYKDTKPFEDMINDALEKGLGEHAIEYKELQRGYRDQVYPLRENAVADKIREGNPLSNDIASELAGDQEGQELLRGMANRNPEIRRNIIGQQYKKNADLVHNPDERLREYTNNMPELNNLLENRNQVSNSIQEANQNIQTAERNHAEAKAREKEAHEISKQAKENAKQLGKETADKLAEIESKKDYFQKEMTGTYEGIKKAQEELKKAQAHYDEILQKKVEFNKAKKNTKVSLKEMTLKAKEAKKLEVDLKQAEKELKDADFGIKGKIHFAYKLIKKLITSTPA